MKAYKFTTKNPKALERKLGYFGIVNFLRSTLYFDLSLEGTKFNSLFSELLSILLVYTVELFYNEMYFGGLFCGV